MRLRDDPNVPIGLFGLVVWIGIFGLALLPVGLVYGGAKAILWVFGR